MNPGRSFSKVIVLEPALVMCWTVPSSHKISVTLPAVSSKQPIWALRTSSQPAFEVVLADLDEPRGLLLGPDLVLCVVEAGTAEWDGVRNHQASNNMKTMKLGDRVFFYHSGSEKRIVGIVEVAKEYYPDGTDASTTSSNKNSSLSFLFFLHVAALCLLCSAGTSEACTQTLRFHGVTSGTVIC